MCMVYIQSVFQKRDQKTMKQSLVYLGVFALGVLLAIPNLMPQYFIENDISKWILYLLLFLMSSKHSSPKK